MERARMGRCAPGLPHPPSMAPRAYCDQAGSARERILPHFPYPPRGAASAPFRIFRLAFARNREYSFEGSLYGLRKPLGTLRPDPIGGRLVSAYVSKIAERRRCTFVMSQAASWGERYADASGGST